jgi:hypothetical protein
MPAYTEFYELFSVYAGFFIWREMLHRNKGIFSDHLEQGTGGNCFMSENREKFCK